jgi:sulfite exporter TauE/SafE
MITAVSILAASLVGSVHCAAMCGPIAAAAGGSGRAALTYHATRLAGYGALGLAAGGIGSVLDGLGRGIGIIRVSAITGGVLLILFGLVQAASALGIRLGPKTRVAASLARTAAWGRRLAPIPRAAAFGLLTAVLPCGWLIAFVAAAAATGDPVSAAAAMAIFWLGTVPAVAGAGLVMARLAGRYRARLPLVSAAVLICFGLVTALARPAQSAHHRLGSRDHPRPTDSVRSR